MSCSRPRSKVIRCNDLITCKSQFILLAPDEFSWVVCECPKLAAVYVQIGHGSAAISVRRNRLAELQSTRDATNKSLSHPETESSSGAGKRYARPRVSSCVVLVIIIHLPTLSISTSAAVVC